MKKVLKFVKGKKDERKENNGGITPSQSGDLLSPAQTPEDERFLGLDSSFGYVVDFGAKDKSLTKLHKAAWQGNLEKLKSALKKVEIDAVDKHNRTALHFAVVQGHPNIVWFLLGNNASTSICDDEGCTPLIKAIECGHRECLKLLLEKSTDINVADYTGNTGLHVAVKQGSIDSVTALLSKQVNMEVSNNAGDYPLHIATKSENKDLVDLLLRSGAEVNVLDRENRTPLMLAAKNGNLLLTNLFVECGAQLTMVDSNGWTADDHALLGGHETVASSLKTLIREQREKAKDVQNGQQHQSTSAKDEDKGNESWGESQSDSSDKTDRVTKKLKEFFKNCSREEEEEEKEHKTDSDPLFEKSKDKAEDILESPSTAVMPPYCQPPRSWDMIQAGMIDGNKPGAETKSKRLSLTTLGTLHSRKESFTEGIPMTSPKYTLSLNRRKGAKVSNSFAKQRLSFNEEMSFDRKRTTESAKNQEANKKDDVLVNGIGTIPNPCSSEEKRELSQRGNDADVSSKSEIEKELTSDTSDDWDSTEKEGTLGRSDTLKGSEEIWVSSAQEPNFPPPPSALELGVDMARSLRYIKGMSEDYPMGSAADRNLWKNAYETHSLDCLEEKSCADGIGRSESNAEFSRQQTTSSLRWKSLEIPGCQKSTDKLVDVNKRISEQLECYDQALRELAETSASKISLTATPEKPSKGSVNYYSLPSSKVRSGSAGNRDRDLPKCGSVGKFVDSGPSSAPQLGSPTMNKCENNEKLGLETPDTKKTNGEPADSSSSSRKTKRHILMAMREVRHAIHVSSAFKTSFDDQILSPLTKPEDSFDLDEPKETRDEPEMRNSQNDDALAFFALGRQQTVLERKSSSSGTGDEPTLWLQSNVERKNGQANASDDDVSDISTEGNHKMTPPFSPLGVIYREIQNECEKSDERKTCESAHRKTEESANEKQKDGISSLRNSLLGRCCNGEDEEPPKETQRDQSPDISLSSGPIEPLETEKDSGSDPESNDNDITPTHHYSLKTQQEWLKSHLKTATTEKNRLEEIAAQLLEKTERLQYELADAKEATKSRDEVIKLLQDQLSRMETAYTKSLEESVQSRLQLTSHEQEILHLKEICFKYEEEKTREDAETEAGNLEKLEVRIKRLEGEKEKMKEEIVQLESEKTSLVKRLKEVTESEIIDQCQRWKERYDEREEDENSRNRNRTSGNSKEANERRSERERILQERNSELEKKVLEMTEENAVLGANLQKVLGDVESEKKMMNVKKEIDDSVCELKRKNLEMEAQVKCLEREIEEKKATDVREREKEKEIELMLKQLSQDKNSLIELYERKLAEKQQHDQVRKEENAKIKEILEKLQVQVANLEGKYSRETVKESLKSELFELKDQCNLVSKAVAEIQNRDNQDLNFLLRENLNLKNAISEIKISLPREESRGKIDFKEKYVDLACENVKMKNVILDLKSQVQSLTCLVHAEGSRTGEETAAKESSLERANRQQSAGRLEENGEAQKGTKRRPGAGTGDHLAWSNLYGIKGIERMRSWKSEKDDELENGEKSNEERGAEASNFDVKRSKNESVERLELLKLKKEIAFLQNKMSGEKAMREALENQINEINKEMIEKEVLQQEVLALKRKINRDHVQKLDLELVQYQKELREKREKYMEEVDKKAKNDDYRDKCEILAKEREKSKEIRNKILSESKLIQPRDWRSSPVTSKLSCPSVSFQSPEPEILVSSQFVPPQQVTTLEPEIKSHLDKELERSIRKYKSETSPSRTSSTLQIDLLRDKRSK